MPRECVLATDTGLPDDTHLGPEDDTGLQFIHALRSLTADERAEFVGWLRNSDCPQIAGLADTVARWCEERAKIEAELHQLADQSEDQT